MVELSLRPYKFKNLADIRELHSVNGSDVPITHNTLPKIGYIVYFGIQPIACGFLRRLEPFYAQIDTLASNKLFGAEIRNLGISAIVNTLLEDARRLKLQGIICHTADNGILKRAEALGFTVVPQTIIAKSL